MPKATPYTKHILISQIKNVGDVVLALPIAGLIREYYPDAIISFLGTNYTKPIISRCADVNHILDWDILSKQSDKEIIATFQSANITAIIHLSNHVQIAKLAKLAGIPCRIGTSQRLIHWLYSNYRINQARRHSLLHEIESNAQMLRPLGIYSSLNASELASRTHLKPEAPLPSKIETLLTHSKRFNLVLHPGSNGHGREWPSHYFKQLIDALPDEDYQIFLTGRSEEQERFKELIQESPKAINLMGTMTLDEFLTFISRVDGLVASGTGPLHLSAALGINTLGLFPPRKGISPRRWGPAGKQALVYNRPSFKICLLCQKNVGCFCMTKISVKQVFNVIKSWRHAS